MPIKNSLANYKVGMFAACLLATFLTNTNPLKAQHNGYPKEIEARIKQVEKSLGESIKTSNEPIYLIERMEEYNVPAVSIAVIKDFKLEWVRAYGVIEKGSTATATPV